MSRIGFHGLMNPLEGGGAAAPGRNVSLWGERKAGRGGM